MSDDERIRGKVARILNSREVAINRGKSDGVRKGMVFAILDESADDITDPDTGEVLGSVERTKVLVKVTEVADRISVAKTYTFQYTGGGAYAGLTGVARLFEPRQKVYDTLEYDDDVAAELDEADSFVKVGDPVKRAIFEA